MVSSKLQNPVYPSPRRHGPPPGATATNKRITVPYPSPGCPVYKNPQPSTWVSYSGQDIRAYIQLYGDMIWLANLYTLSYSTYRDVIPVRGLGQAGPLGHARGHRTIAGSIVFTQFNKDALFDFISYMAHDRNASGWYPAQVDQIPPFNMIVLASGEVTREVYSPQYRDIQRQVLDKDSPSSRMIIYQLTMSGSGGTMSVDDMITEQVCNYHALGIAPLMDINDGVLAGSPQLTADDQSRLLREAKRYGQEPVAAGGAGTGIRATNPPPAAVKATNPATQAKQAATAATTAPATTKTFPQGASENYHQQVSQGLAQTSKKESQDFGDRLSDVASKFFGTGDVAKLLKDSIKSENESLLPNDAGMPAAKALMTATSAAVAREGAKGKPYSYDVPTDGGAVKVVASPLASDADLQNVAAGLMQTYGGEVMVNGTVYAKEPAMMQLGSFEVGTGQKYVVHAIAQPATGSIA